VSPLFARVWRGGVLMRGGRIAVYYFRSQRYDLGDAKCWVDDNVAGAKRLPGWWEREYNVARCVFPPLLSSAADPSCSVAYIDEKVTPGDH
jgi:hypothetical protein